MSEMCMNEITGHEEKIDGLEQQMQLTQSENERITQELNNAEKQLKAA
jgi:hypothetical protein